MSKKLEEKQRRRLAEEAKRQAAKRDARRRNLITITLALLVAAGVVYLVISDRNAREGQENQPIGVSEGAAGCGQVEEHEDQGRDHIAEGEPHEPYNSSPPTSGPHYGSPGGPVDTGFYPSPLPPEAVVHNLEHGQIVIWYRPDAQSDTIDDIEALVDQQPTATVAVPYEGVEDPYDFVLTAWTVSRGCERVSQAVVDEFRRDYQGKSPEPLTARFRG